MIILHGDQEFNCAEIVLMHFLFNGTADIADCLWIHFEGVSEKDYI